VNPPSVPPGGKFDVVVDYSVKDSTTQQQQISAQLTIEILDGEQLIYSHELIEMISTNGGSTRRTEPLAGSKTAGAYTLRASVKYGEYLGHWADSIQHSMTLLLYKPNLGPA